jgi:hypothetical protein
MTAPETEVNGDSRSTNGLVVLVQEIFVLPCRPSNKYFFLTVHYFTSFVPIAQQAGQAGVLRSLSLVSLKVLFKTLLPILFSSF